MHQVCLLSVWGGFSVLGSDGPGLEEKGSRRWEYRLCCSLQAGVCEAPWCVDSCICLLSVPFVFSPMADAVCCLLPSCVLSFKLLVLWDNGLRLCRATVIQAY